MRKKINRGRKKINRLQNFLDDAEKKFEGGKTFYLMRKKIKQVRKKIKWYQNFFFDAEKKLNDAEKNKMHHKKN